MKKYPRLGYIYKEDYLAHGSGGWEVQEQGTSICSAFES
jgi:hypothetical protein